MTLVIMHFINPTFTDYSLRFRFPVGYITAKDELGVKPAPVMADFSSRGPNTITPQILKVGTFINQLSRSR